MRYVIILLVIGWCSVFGQDTTRYDFEHGVTGWADDGVGSVVSLSLSTAPSPVLEGSQSLRLVPSANFDAYVGPTTMLTWSQGDSISIQYTLLTDTFTRKFYMTIRHGRSATAEQIINDGYQQTIFGSGDADSLVTVNDYVIAGSDSSGYLVVEVAGESMGYWIDDIEVINHGGWADRQEKRYYFRGYMPKATKKLR